MNSTMLSGHWSCCEIWCSHSCVALSLKCCGMLYLVEWWIQLIQKIILPTSSGFRTAWFDIQVNWDLQWSHCFVIVVDILCYLLLYAFFLLKCTPCLPIYIVVLISDVAFSNIMHILGSCRTVGIMLGKKAWLYWLTRCLKMRQRIWEMSGTGSSLSCMLAVSYRTKPD